MATLLALAATAPGDAAPAPRMAGHVGSAMFHDSMATTVWTPNAEVDATLPGEVNLGVDITTDIITSASVDVVTAATGRMTELRNEIGVTARHDGGGHGLGLDGGYAYSFERDSASHIMHAGAHRPLLDQALELRLGAGLSYNRAGVVDEPRDRWRSSWVASGDAGLSCTLGPRTTVELGDSFLWSEGYQASPYRRVPVTIGPDLRGASWLPENVPGRRLRNAIVLRARRGLGRSWVAALDYRLYTDDWGVTGHTVGAEASVEPRPGLVLRARQRGSTQGAAYFYRERYDMPALYLSRDRRLSEQVTTASGLGLTWQVGRSDRIGTVRVHAAADLLGWRYHDFLAPALHAAGDPTLRTLGWVTATVVQLGFEVEP